ncbi:MAG: AAA family ATPase [Geodermatophilaceae bacterium]|nr:AAA family ATPase [Geodermatophilaceae bacterium]
MVRTSSQIPLLGRARELERLLAVVGSSRAGEPSTILLAGDAGVGKTRLLRELGDWAAGEDLILLVGHCVDLGELGLPYLPFTEILGALTHDPDPGVAEMMAAHPGVVSLFSGEPGQSLATGSPGRTDPDLPDRVAPAPAGSGQRQLFEAIATLLFELADLRPVLLVIEDLHWADQSTRDLLRFLISRLTDQPVMIIASYRTDDLHRRHPLRPWLAEMARVEIVDRLVLAPLDDPDMAALVRAVRPDRLSDAVLRRIVERAEGNPFYAEELAAAGGSGDFGFYAGVASAAGGAGGVPDGLSDILLARLEALPTDAQHVVRVAAIAGRSVAHEVLAAVAGLPSPALDAAIREAVNRYILVAEDDGKYQFRHALLRESAYGDLLPGERVRLHAAFAEQLADTGSAAELALHYRESNDLAGALGASWQAARDAARLRGPVEQLQHLERLLSLWPSVPDAAQRIGRSYVDAALEASDAASDAGERTRSIKLARLALERLEADPSPDPGLAVRVQYTLGQTLLNADRDAEAYVHTSAAMDVLGPESTPQNARTWAWAAAIHMRSSFFNGKYEESKSIGEAALAVAEKYGVDDARADLLITIARVYEKHPEGSGSVDRLARALELARSSGDIGTEMRATYNLAVAAFNSGDLTEAVRVLKAGNRRAVETGVPYGAYATETLFYTVHACFIAGDWATVRSIVDACRAYGPESTRHVVAAGMYRGVARGEDVSADLAEARRWSELPILAIIVGIVSAELAIAAGSPADARTAVTDAIERVTALWDTTFMAKIRLIALLTCAYADQVERLRMVRDAAGVTSARAEVQPFLDDAAEVISSCRAERGSDSLGVEADAWVLRLAAESSRLDDNGADAVRAWRAAVHGFGYGDRYEQARSRLRLAEALIATDQRPEAQAEARLAYAVARELGAAPLVAAVESLARRARLDIGAPTSARSDGAGLTRREQEVLDLLARGRTNRQIGKELFISEKTASVHVSNILGKLHASGRTEAVTIAHHRGLISA